jgi:pimeloyl-ACP methyl ester carboxylesterase
MKPLARIIALIVLPALAATLPRPATAQADAIGIVIMHGKGGLPAGYVANLARTLEAKGYLVANLEMPWSRNRNYDVTVERGEQEVETAAAGLRGKGARKVFVAGHSQGGAFALHLASKTTADGIIAMAPGGDVSNRVFRENLGASVARARRLVAEGKGNEPARLEDYEGARGTYTIVAIPAAYVTWFDTDGAMNMQRAARAANPRVPILWIVGQGERPPLRKVNIPLFSSLPDNSLTRLYEPDADHTGTPTASAEEIIRWTRDVAGRNPGS